MITIIKVKKYIANACIFSIIIGKFCHWQKLRPVILFLIDKNLKKNFYGTILLFNLAVNLCIENNRKPLFDA